jgi:hypothetical protein
MAYNFYTELKLHITVASGSVYYCDQIQLEEGGHVLCINHTEPAQFPVFRLKAEEITSIRLTIS